MNIVAEILAQAEGINWTGVVAQNGPLGVMCAWLMFRVEKKVESVALEVITELHVLGHRINGMTRAMLADVASRETTGNAIKVLIATEMKKLEEEDDVKELRARRKG